MSSDDVREINCISGAKFQCNFLTKKINHRIFIIKNWGLKGKLSDLSNSAVWDTAFLYIFCFGWVCGLRVRCPSVSVRGFDPQNHVGAGFSSCCHVKPEISSSLSARGPSFAEQPGEQSQNFPHTWTGLWVCNKADSRPSFSWLCYRAFCTDLLFTALIFFFFFLF